MNERKNKQTNKQTNKHTHTHTRARAYTHTRARTPHFRFCLLNLCTGNTGDTRCVVVDRRQSDWELLREKYGLNKKKKKKKGQPSMASTVEEAVADAEKKAARPKLEKEGFLIRYVHGITIKNIILLETFRVQRPGLSSPSWRFAPFRPHENKHPPIMIFRNCLPLSLVQPHPLIALFPPSINFQCSLFHFVFCRHLLSCVWRTLLWIQFPVVTRLPRPRAAGAGSEQAVADATEEVSQASTPE